MLPSKKVIILSNGKGTQIVLQNFCNRQNTKRIHNSKPGYSTYMVLTHNMAMIQPSFTSSKCNMSEIFGLKFHLSCVHTVNRTYTTFFIEISWCGNQGIFVTEFFILGKNPPFNAVNEWVQKWFFPHVEISKIFNLYHFSPSFLVQKR